MSDDPNQQAASGGGAPEILMESGSVLPDGDACGECWVSRGMPAITTDGLEAGWVAAVVLDGAGKSTAVVLARPRITLEYYLLPPGLINRVNDGRVLLRVSARAVASLPRRQTT